MTAGCLVEWSGVRCRLTYAVHIDNLLPVTSVHGFCFRAPVELLVIDHATRGIDIPGGHLELHESPVEAFAREVLEEACVSVSQPSPTGAILVESLQGPRGRYPERSQILFFAASVAEELPFEARFETVGRRFINPTELPRLHRAWNPALQEALSAAVKSRSVPCTGCNP